MSWTRRDVARGFQTAIGCSFVQGQALLEELLEVMTEGLVQEGEVQITGFATFQVKGKKERPGRNPKTQEPKVITARRVISFRPSSKVSVLLTAIEDKEPS